MKSVAVLLDGGFITYKLYRPLGNRHAEARDIIKFARACLRTGEELFRIYYYDCPPFEEKKVNPISRLEVDFSQTATFERCEKLQHDLKHANNVAFRAGHLMFSGWAISRRATTEMLRAPAPRAVRADDLEPAIKQKRVDMKIGLDIAWLSGKGIVKKIILVTGDTDFVPAMKFARREGVQVIVATTDGKLRGELREHADEIRIIKVPAQPLQAVPVATAPTP